MNNLLNSKNYLEGLRSIWQLFYPDICSACLISKPTKSHLFCLQCQLDLPVTDHHLILKNELFKRFIGRIQLESALALYYFSKKGVIQRCIHQLKYKTNQSVGVFFGRELAKRILNSSYMSIPDLIIPVPVDKTKKRLRGYNQCEVIAKELSNKTNIPFSKNHLTKPQKSLSQTTKSRIDRFNNVLDSFHLQNEKELVNKHILIVDDVCTTGATLEACAVKLEHIKDVRISFAIIAMAQ